MLTGMYDASTRAFSGEKRYLKKSGSPLDEGTRRAILLNMCPADLEAKIEDGSYGGRLKTFDEVFGFIEAAVANWTRKQGQKATPPQHRSAGMLEEVTATEEVMWDGDLYLLTTRANGSQAWVKRDT